MRTQYNTANFATNALAHELLANIPALDLWTYLNSTANPVNLVNNAPLLQTGTPVRRRTYTQVEPAVSYYTLPNLFDLPTQTFMFVAKMNDVGGNFAPFITAYGGATGLMLGIGSDYLRIHPAGISALLNHSFPSVIGNEYGFWSVILESGATTPIRIKNWTYNLTATGGTSGASRINTGTALTIAGHSIATTGIFKSQGAFIARAGAALSDEHILRCYNNVRTTLPLYGMNAI